MKNILVTSISNKVPFLEAVKLAAKGKHSVIGCDTHLMCVGKHFVDSFWQCPPLIKWTTEMILKKCEELNIFAVIPSRDQDVEFFAQHRDLFTKRGIFVLVSNFESVKICNDKMRFYQVLSSHDLPVIPTSAVLEELDFERVVIKEKYGSGALHIFLNQDFDRAKENARSLSVPIYQPYIEGNEYSIDAYVTTKGEVKGVIIRSRDCIVKGESQVTTSVKDSALEALSMKVIQALGLTGHLLLQVIRDKEGKDHIIECNVRFGGASTLSIAMGLDTFGWFLAEALGENVEALPFQRSEKEKRLIRIAKDMITCL